MSPGAVAVTRMSWCPCELPTCLCECTTQTAAWGPPPPLLPSPKGLARAGMTGARRPDPLGVVGLPPGPGKAPGVTLTITNPLETEGVASATQATVPESENSLLLLIGQRSPLTPSQPQWTIIY